MSSSTAAESGWTASTGATAYVVRLHRPGLGWISRRTPDVRVALRGVDVAKVVAVNPGGESATTTGRR